MFARASMYIYCNGRGGSADLLNARWIARDGECGVQRLDRRGAEMLHK